MKVLRRGSAGCVFFLMVLLGRNLFEARSEFQLGRSEEARGNLKGAIGHFDRSIHWYFPGNPYNERAIERLWEIGRVAEAKNRKTALLAYDSARGAILSVRSLFQPFEAPLLKVNERIADLRAHEQVESGQGQTLEEALAFHRAVLKTGERPAPFWSAVVIAGFLGWIGCTLGLIWKGFDREGRMHFGRSLPWILGFILSFTAWILGLVRA